MLFLSHVLGFHSKLSSRNYILRENPVIAQLRGFTQFYAVCRGFTRFYARNTQLVLRTYYANYAVIRQLRKFPPQDRLEMCSLESRPKIVTPWISQMLLVASLSFPGISEVIEVPKRYNETLFQ